MAQLETAINKLAEIEQTIERLKSEVLEINKMQEELSPSELEYKVEHELEYFRDLVKLSTRRLHLESNPLVRPDDKFFTFEILKDCLDRVVEFDPLIFKNDRVAIFDRPEILLVPGSGNSLYDWKNNRIMVPIVPPGGNFLASIAAGIIRVPAGRR